VTSPDYCGSGGCVTLVLQRTGQGYRTVMRASVTRPPIRVLETQHQGWKDIGVTISGGGAGPVGERELSPLSAVVVAGTGTRRSTSSSTGPGRPRPGWCRSPSGRALPRARTRSIRERCGTSTR
jgi:hypothetical protein